MGTLEHSWGQLKTLGNTWGPREHLRSGRTLGDTRGSWGNRGIWGHRGTREHGALGDIWTLGDIGALGI